MLLHGLSPKMEEQFSRPAAAYDLWLLDSQMDWTDWGQSYIYRIFSNNSAGL